MLKIAISPCPNDIFIFGPIMRGIVGGDLKFEFILEDVEHLNRWAIDGKYDIIKVSYGVVNKIIDKYKILTSGGALGYKNGPIVVSKKQFKVDDLKGKKIAIPGFNTTAFLLFKTFFGEDYQFVEMRFDMVFAATATGIVDAGVIIHEGRFVYNKYGFHLICDLGEIWEERYNLPIPLGAIAIKNEIVTTSEEIKRMIRNSIRYSFDNCDESKKFCKNYSQELDDTVLENHITYFVNDYSIDMSNLSKSIASIFKIPSEAFV